MKTCEEVMTPNPICCLPTDNVKKVAQLMKQGNIGPIPVIENELTRKLIGIITDRDLAIKVVAEGCDPDSTKAEAVMSRKVVTCRADEPVKRALKLMSKRQLRRIIVVDPTNKILGIISQADIATRIDQPQSTAELVKDVSQDN